MNIDKKDFSCSLPRAAILLLGLRSELDVAGEAEKLACKDHRIGPDKVSTGDGGPKRQSRAECCLQPAIPVEDVLRLVQPVAARLSPFTTCTPDRYVRYLVVQAMCHKKRV